MDLRDAAASLTIDQIAALLAQVQVLSHRVQEQDHQLEWFRKQLFGAKSERRILDEIPIADQMWLGQQMLDVPEKPPEPGTSVVTYERKHRRSPVELVESDSRLRFDPSVPVETIVVPNPDLDGIPEDQLQQVSEKVTYRLAQRSSYVVLKYVRPVVKLKDTSELHTPALPPAVIRRSPADVSLLAGMVVDKFDHHLPLYRQHQRMEQCGVYLERGTLTRLVHRVGELIEPIYTALLSSVLQSQVLTVDESPTPAGIVPALPGSGKHGKMGKGYFWAFFGDQIEVAFVFSPTRARSVLDAVLEGFQGKKLLSDGYEAYTSYVNARKAAGDDLTQVQCWNHSRRNFVEAEGFEPKKVLYVLRQFQRLYEVEDRIADKDFDTRLRVRQQVSKPIVDKLFEFFTKETATCDVLLPSNRFLQAINYALEREAELRVYLDDPRVPIDTNHVERTLRSPAVGRKNWMFHVTEVGARYGAMFYSLIESCHLCGVNPTVYLIDVLLRIDTHPAAEIHLLVPRLWKERFSQQPMRSDVSRSP